MVRWGGGQREAEGKKAGPERRLAQLSWRRDEGCPSGGIDVMEAA